MYVTKFQLCKFGQKLWFKKKRDDWKKKSETAGPYFGFYLKKKMTKSKLLFRRDHQKNSYERRAYESVDEKSLS